MIGGGGGGGGRGGGNPSVIRNVETAAPPQLGTDGPAVREQGST